MEMLVRIYTCSDRTLRCGKQIQSEESRPKSGKCMMVVPNKGIRTVASRRMTVCANMLATMAEIAAM